MAMLIGMTAWIYGEWTWQTPERAMDIVMGLEAKPFVFRVLVPFLGRSLMWLGLEAQTALQVVVTVSAIGLYWAIRRLWDAVR